MAIAKNNPEVLEALHLNPPPAHAVALAAQVAHKNMDLCRTFIKAVPREQINGTPRGSCSTLESLVSHASYRDFDTGTTSTESEAADLEFIKLLLEAGARWDPPPARIRSDRRAILEHDGTYIVQLFRLLFSIPNAVNTDTLLELCRSQTLTTRITMTDRRFSNELQALGQSRPPNAPLTKAPSLLPRATRPKMGEIRMSLGYTMLQLALCRCVC